MKIYTITVTAEEWRVLYKLVSPKNLRKLYGKLVEFERSKPLSKEKIDDALASGRYGNLTSNYKKSHEIKDSIIKNQLSLLVLYTHISKNKVVGDKYEFRLTESLVCELIETITFRILAIDCRLKDKEISELEKELEILRAAVKSIENSISVIELYLLRRNQNDDNLNESIILQHAKRYLPYRGRLPQIADINTRGGK